ncbi:MAG: InlB B-repeat-containing protein [Treponema sp.]|jgi:hypothetical protein|nr:InlB B-repeat-containing protein [Treponema sp.]
MRRTREPVILILTALLCAVLFGRCQGVYPTDYRQFPGDVTVTLHANGGTFDDGADTRQITASYGTNLSLKGLPLPLAGSVLKGWFTLSAEDETYTAYDYSKPVVRNISLYALWDG